MALLLSMQSSATAGHSPSPGAAQIRQFSRDLIETDSIDFFRIGKKRIEREAQILQRRRQSSTKPLLNINEVPIQEDGPINIQPN